MFPGFLLLQEYNRKLNKDPNCSARVRISFVEKAVAVNDRHNCYGKLTLDKNFLLNRIAHRNLGLSLK